MKPKFYLLIITVCIAAKLNSQEVITTSFTSNSLNGEEIPLNVYLPSGYEESGDPYNLYIFLHGSSGLNHNSHIDEFEARLNQLIADGVIDPLVAVFPSAQGADFGNRHMWFNSERNGLYADLITVDLLQWTEANFNVSESKRAVGGFSMGGDGALRIALHNSDKFVASVSHSAFPALDFFPNLIPLVISESSQSMPPYSYVPSPGSFITQRVYGVSSAWSPNNSNSNYMVDFPLDENGVLIDSVFSRWKINADADSIIRHNWGTSKDVPVNIYFDVGTGESLFYPANDLLNTEFSELVQNEGYNLNYTYNEFSGGHLMTEQKIDSSLIWLNNVFSNVMTSSQEVLENPDTGLLIFPNPTSRSIKIIFNDEALNAEYLVQLMSVKGEIMYYQIVRPVGEKEFELDLSFIGNGIYQVMVTDKRTNEIYSEKVIKF